MIRIKNAVYPVVAAAALMVVAWQPMDTAPVGPVRAPIERSVSSDFGDWFQTVAPMSASSASSQV